MVTSLTLAAPLETQLGLELDHASRARIGLPKRGPVTVSGISVKQKQPHAEQGIPARS